MLHVQIQDYSGEQSFDTKISPHKYLILKINAKRVGSFVPQSYPDTREGYRDRTLRHTDLTPESRRRKVNTRLLTRLPTILLVSSRNTCVRSHKPSHIAVSFSELRAEQGRIVSHLWWTQARGQLLPASQQSAGFLAALSRYFGGCLRPHMHATNLGSLHPSTAVHVHAVKVDMAYLGRE